MTQSAFIGDFSTNGGRCQGMTYVLSSARRVTDRAKREVAARVPPVQWLANATHDARLQAHAPHLPTLGTYERELLKELQLAGAVRTSLAGLGLSGLGAVMGALDGLVNVLARADSAAGTTVKAAPKDLLADLSLWHFGVNEGLLALVENYIGLPVRYCGAAVYRGVAHSKLLDTREWHRDVEDRRMVKLLVWLNDVGAEGGALRYVSKPRTKEAVRQLRYVSGRLTDASMRAAVPPHEWIRATGPRWTAVFVDPAQVLHRAGPAEARDRYSVTFTWTSRQPLTSPPGAQQFSPADIERIRHGLNPAQRASLPLAMQLDSELART